MANVNGKTLAILMIATVIGFVLYQQFALSSASIAPSYLTNTGDITILFWNQYFKAIPPASIRTDIGTCHSAHDQRLLNTADVVVWNWPTAEVSNNTPLVRPRGALWVYLNGGAIAYKGNHNLELSARLNGSINLMITDIV